MPEHHTVGLGSPTVGHRHRWLAVAAAAVALPAVGGAVSLANGTIDMGEAIVDRFPWQSVELAGLALFACVAVPFAALAVLAWRGSHGPAGHRGRRAAAGAWIVVQLLVIRTLSFFHPTYLAIGLSFAWVGRRMERRERRDQRTRIPGPSALSRPWVTEDRAVTTSTTIDAPATLAGTASPHVRSTR